MIKRITKVSDAVKLGDILIDLSKKPDLRGNTIERDRNFTIIYRGDKPDFIETRDINFNPEKIYYVRKENGRRPVIATPESLDLFTYNGLNYVPCRKDHFENGKEYFFQSGDNNYVKADARNQKLVEKTAPTKVYYKVVFISPSGTQIDIVSLDGDDFEKAKEILEWCKQNRQEILNEYQDAIELDASPARAIQNFVEERSTVREDRRTQNLATRTQNAQVVTTRRRQTRTSTPFGDPNWVASVLDGAGLTRNQIDPASPEFKEIFDRVDNDGIEFQKKIRKAQTDAYGFYIYYNGSKYYMNPRRTPNTVLGEFILNGPNASKWYKADTIETLSKQIKELSHILQDFKDHAIDEGTLQDLLTKGASVTDSFKTSKKNLITRITDDKEEEVYGEFGVYFNEQTGKYVVKIKTPSGRLIRLGEFNNARTARMASQAFKNADYDPLKFAESDFYLDNIQYFKNFYQMYVEGKRKNDLVANKFHIVKSPENEFMVFYDNEGSPFYVQKKFASESRAQEFINNALKSGDAIQYIRKYNSSKSDIDEDLLRVGIENTVKNEYMTYSDMKDLGEVLANAMKDVDVQTALSVLRGSKEEHQKLYLNVVDLVEQKLEELGYTEEQIRRFTEQYQLMLPSQEALMRTVIEDLIKKAIDEVTQETISKYRYAQEDPDRDGYGLSIAHFALDEDTFTDKVLRKVSARIPFDRPTYDKGNYSFRKRIIRKYLDYRRALRNAE